MVGRVRLVPVHVNEVGHAEDTGHPTSVVAEEDTAKRREDTHEVRLGRDRGLNPT